MCALPFTAPGASAFVEGDRDPGDVFVAAEQHRSLVDAIEHREGTRAEALAREHTRVVRRTLELSLQRRAAMAGLPGGPLIVY